MSGHSKWSKVKHQKEATDAVKGKIFTKMANAIIIAVGHGGGTDPASNFKLRLAIDRARSVNMPREKIDRAIERGKGTGTQEVLEELLYEAFGPSGVGILIETATNNKQRTVAELKNILDRSGGHLAQIGTVTHMFEHGGLIRVGRSGKTADELMEAAIQCGAIDIDVDGSEAEIFTTAESVHEVKVKLEELGIPVSSFELYFRPRVAIPLSDRPTAEKLLRLLSTLEEFEDVQKVCANFDIPDEYLYHS